MAKNSNGESAKRKPGGKPFTPGQSGNPTGKPPGTKSYRTLQWEALGEHIQGQHTEGFNSLLESLFTSSDTNERLKGADLYLRALEYFKPKLNRTEVKQEGESTIVVRFE